MTTIQVKLTHAAVKVTNVKAAVKFFSSVLGFTPAWEQEDWGMVKGHGTTLAVIEKSAKVHPPHIGFVVPSRDAVDHKYQELKDHPEIQSIQEPKDHRDQSRSFYFEDKDHNVFEILWIPENLTR